MITADVPSTSMADRVRSCREAQQSWEKLPVRERLQPVRALRHLLVGECDALCGAVERDIGKPPKHTLAAEILPLAAACRFLERRAAGLLKPRAVSLWDRPLWLWGERDTVLRRPRGVVGIIGTWNFPLLLNGVQIMQALTAGNGVLWKPSEVAPSSAERLHQVLLQAGFPERLVQRLPATREAGPELASAEIDHCVFTGSSAVGRVLAEQLGRRLISSTLELSGCDALFVLEDGDIGMAARAAWFGATLNHGQACVASRRIFVQRSRYEEFIGSLRPLVAAAGPACLALAGQVQQAERLIDEAVANGARRLDAPRALDSNGANNVFRPAALLDVRPEMQICRQASFAPVLAVLPFDSEAEALRMNASCAYGLGAAIFSRDTARAKDLATHLLAGVVAVNDVVVPTAHPATPFGGRGESGWGVTQGAEGLLEMTVPQVVSIRRGQARPHYPAPDGTTKVPVEMLRGLLEWSHGHALAERWAGLRRLIKGWWNQN
jgi:acyl-CoA reductase-like NAD-dependent aldehyde dehydrogenase